MITSEQAERARYEELAARLALIDKAKAASIDLLATAEGQAEISSALDQVRQIGALQATEFLRQAALSEHELEVERRLKRKRADAEATRLYNAEVRGPATTVQMDISELLQRPPLEWIWEGWIPESAVGFLTGRSYTGKTFTALGLALSMAAGVDFLGESVKQGKVLYVAGEGVAGLGGRARAYIAEHQLTVSPEDFHVVDPGGGVLTDPEFVADMTERIREGQYSLVVFDTYGVLSGVEDENSSASGSAVLRAARSMVSASPGCSALFLHHPPGDGTGAKTLRGTTALYGNADTVIVLDPETTEHGSPFSLTTYPSRGGKQKDAEPQRMDGLQIVGAHGSAVVTRTINPIVAQETPVTRAIRLLGQSLSSGEEYDTQQLLGLLTGGLFISESRAADLLTKVVRDGDLLERTGKGRYLCTRSTMESLLGD